MSRKVDKIEGILVDVDRAKRVGDVFHFSSSTEESTPSSPGLLDKIKYALKSFGPLYNLLVVLFSPVMPNFKTSARNKNIMSKYDQTCTVLNLGCGPDDYLGREDLINVDLHPYSVVDMVADCTALPVKEAKVDCVVNIAMLEHVPAPNLVIDEMHRVLKPGGELICYAPFLVPFHAAPSDYYRWTKKGLELAFSNFSEVEIVVGPGPTSALLWIGQEFLSTALCFGIQPLKDILFLFFMIISFPIKILDLYLAHLKLAEGVASGFYIYAKK